MNKIRVAHYTKSCSYSGTDRTAQTFCKHLDKDKFDVYYLYNKNAANERLNIVKDLLGTNHVIEIDHEDAVNPQPPYHPARTNLWDILHNLTPDIFHLHHSGHNEHPLLPRLKENVRKVVTTNIFGYSSSYDFLIDKKIFICQYIWKMAGSPQNSKIEILNNPIEPPVTTEDLREELGLEAQEVVLGRVGRADNFCPISLDALAILKKKYGLTPRYLIVNPCKNWMEKAFDLGIDDQCIFYGPVYGDANLSRLYNTMDILAHARSDGEVDSVTLGQAFIHGKPVVTHCSGGHNGQVEQINLSNGGFYADSTHASEQYAHQLLALISNNSLRIEMGNSAKLYAEKYLNAALITKRLENIYLGVI